MSARAAAPQEYLISVAIGAYNDGPERGDHLE